MAASLWVMQQFPDQLVIAAAGFVVSLGLLRRHEARYDAIDRGFRGERRVQRILSRALADYQLFFNVVLPNEETDIDAIVVGPHGVLVLEVKTYSGYYQVRRDGWYRRVSGGSWRRFCNPDGQLWHNVRKVRRFCEQAGFQGRVEGAIVLAGEARLGGDVANRTYLRPNELESFLDELPSVAFDEPGVVRLFLGSTQHNESCA